MTHIPSTPKQMIDKREDRAYLVVKDQSVLPESQRELDRSWRDLARSPELPLEHIRKVVDVDARLDPLNFIEFPILMKGLRKRKSE